ncbi:MAG: topoisomerase C-terminal repeat-containing protein, partial [Pseudomonadota bacterium]
SVLVSLMVVSQVVLKSFQKRSSSFFPPREDGAPPRLCPLCNIGQLALKPGRYGAFIGCSSYPECKYTRQLGGDDTAPEAANPDGKLLGEDPETGLAVTLRSGRFGPYVQLGEPVEKEKPKRASLPKGVTAEDVDLALALRLLRLPREIGPHPDDGEMITAGLGRYGPFVKHNSTYANLASFDEVFDVGLNRAVVLLAEKREKGGKGGRGAAAKPIRVLGDHPKDKKPIELFEGRYGPYVKHGKTNATIPKGADPAALTLDEGVALIDEKAGKKKKK